MNIVLVYYIKSQYNTLKFVFMMDQNVKKNLTGMHTECVFTFMTFVAFCDSVQSLCEAFC